MPSNIIAEISVQAQSLLSIIGVLIFGTMNVNVLSSKSSSKCHGSSQFSLNSISLDVIFGLVIVIVGANCPFAISIFHSALHSDELEPLRTQ